MDVPDGADAELLTIGLSRSDLRAGRVGFGLHVSAGTIALATIAPTDGDLTRRWTTARSVGLAASLTLPGVTASVSDVAVSVNRATGAAVLNWDTALDLDGGGFGDDLVVSTVPLTLSAGATRLAGTLTSLVILDLLTGAAGFEITSTPSTRTSTAAARISTRRRC